MQTLDCGRDCDRDAGRDPACRLADGAGGFGAHVVRRPASDRIAELAAFALHSTEYHGSHTLDIDGRVALSDAAEVLHDIGIGHGPKQSLIAFGYAGWAAGQLEDEIVRGAWVTAPEDPALVFDTDRSKVWTDALALYKNEH